MSKWSKRSPEDKARILAEQEALREKGKQSTAPYRIDDNAQNEIIQRNEIPLVCSEHGYTSSERYELIKEFHPLVQTEITMVRGKCIKCGRISRRAIMLDEGGMTLMLLVTLLQTRGRVDDNR
jgi:hypothetical protein